MNNTIKPNVGDILLDNKGNYHRVLLFARHSERQETLIIHEMLTAKSVHATPASMMKTSNFTIAIKAEDLND